MRKKTAILLRKYVKATQKPSDPDWTYKMAKKNWNKLSHIRRGEYAETIREYLLTA